MSIGVGARTSCAWFTPASWVLDEHIGQVLQSRLQSVAADSSQITITSVLSNIYVFLRCR